MDVKGMVEYKNGRIYKLVCNTTGLVYIGSTTRPLYKRKNSHLSHYNQWKKGNSTYITAFRIIENGDFDIVLIEQVECNTKEELHRAERRWIEQSDCVNKQVPTRDRKEYYSSITQIIEMKGRITTESTGKITKSGSIWQIESII